MKNLVIACLFVALVFGNEVEERDKREILSRTKVGLAWADGNNANIYALADPSWGSSVSWYYNWNSIQSVSAASSIGLEYIPMLWGTASNRINDFNTAKSNNFYGASCVLGFNEPDNSGQSNLSPAAAATAWKQYIQPIGLRKGAPAVTSDSSGIPWLQQFFSACSGCSVDFIPIHWYGSDPGAFIAYVQLVHNTFGKNIWVTEWACVNYDSQSTCQQQSYVDSFMGQTTQFLYQNSWVERFSWFGSLRNMNGIPDTDRLITSDGGSATILGGNYAVNGGCCSGCYKNC